MQAVREGEDEFAERVFGVAFAQEGEGGGVSGGDFAALAHGYQEVVAELPDCVGECHPDYHGAQGVVFGGAGLGVFDRGDGGEDAFLHFARDDVHDHVEGGAWHDVDEKTGMRQLRVVAFEM